MAIPVLVTQQEFTSSRYGQLVEDLETPINDILARAEAVIQAKVGYTFSPTAYTEEWTAGGQRIFVRHRPIISVASISRRLDIRYPWYPLTMGYMRIEKDAGYIDVLEEIKGWDVQVAYTAGYTTTPDDIKEAVIIQAVLLSTQDLEVYGSGDAKQPGYLYMADDIDRLLKRYRQTSTVYH